MSVDVKDVEQVAQELQAKFVNQGNYHIHFKAWKLQLIGFFLFS